MDAEIAARYARFADLEAHGQSALYEQLARYVAASAEAHAFLSGLPVERRQPNLLFAATRFVCGTPRDAREFGRFLAARGSEIRAVMLRRTTQTNEPGRCAALVPALARIEGPISLIEVGASAGLCLLPDRYGYDWGRKTLLPDAMPGTRPPVFPCTVSDGTPLPDRLPSIVWRAGLDLNPVRLEESDAVAWLETLVWPEDTPRLERLRAASAIAKADPPTVEKGDLRHDLSDLIRRAPRDTTVIVFHTAVLSYVGSAEERAAFARAMLASNAVWLANESPRVFPQIAARAAAAPSRGMFLLSRDGVPVAWTGPHGQSVSWL